MFTEAQIRERLGEIKYPGFSRDIVSFGLIKDIRIQGADVTVQMALATNDPRIPQAIKEQSEEALSTLPGIGDVRVLIDIQAPAQTGAAGATEIAGFKHVIAVASGKIGAIEL